MLALGLNALGVLFVRLQQTECFTRQLPQKHHSFQPVYWRIVKQRCP
jgi:hypothetical protein